MKTVLVIGGCGFIGSHIVEQLQRQGLAVRALSRRPEAFRKTVHGVDYVLGSMADADLLDVALDGVDAVIHTASSMVPQTSNLKPVAVITENLISSVQLFQKMKAADVGKLVFLSSGGTVYGIPRQSPLTEDHPLRPISSYGVVKVAIESYIQMFSSLQGLEACILRPSNPYGPRQWRTGLQQGRLKVCPGSPWRGCQHWVRSVGLSAPNGRNPLCRRRSARTG